MYILINLLILFIALFIYIHIFFHIKTSNYLEVYEIDNISKEKFEELCNIKQPLLFKNQNSNIDMELKTIDYNFLINNYSNFDIKIYNKTEDIGLPINLLDGIELFKKDISNIYISEHNNDFLDETTIYKTIKDNDIFFRPYNVTNIDYDIIMGAINSYSILKYSFNYRNILYITSGRIEVTLCPPNNKKYLHCNIINDNLECCSQIDIYNIEEKFEKDFSKVKLLRVNLNVGNFLHIPPYWFYSIKFLENNSLALLLKYRTFMNSLSISPELFKKLLQDNNIKRNFLKLVDV